MHDIDRTTAEFGGLEELGADGQEFGDELEFQDEADFESVLDEADEMQLAADLLEVSDEAELDQFLGKVFKRVASVAGGPLVGNFLNSPLGGLLKRNLKNIARRALPIAGRAIGTYFGGPAGGALGSRLATFGGSMFGLELEGMSHEDQEFEIGRRLVRLAAQAAKNAIAMPATMNAAVAAKTALAKAARKHAPGLLKGAASALLSSATSNGAATRSGRWIRRGRKIILYGV